MHLRRAEYRFHQEHDAFHLLQFDNRLCFVTLSPPSHCDKNREYLPVPAAAAVPKGIFVRGAIVFVNPAAVRTGTASLCCRSVTYTIFPCSFQF